jgi:hypothetical protein
MEDTSEEPPLQGSTVPTSTVFAVPYLVREASKRQRSMMAPGVVAYLIHMQCSSEGITKAAVAKVGFSSIISCYSTASLLTLLQINYFLVSEPGRAGGSGRC